MSSHPNPRRRRRGRGGRARRVVSSSSSSSSSDDEASLLAPRASHLISSITPTHVIGGGSSSNYIYGNTAHSRGTGVSIGIFTDSDSSSTSDSDSGDSILSHLRQVTSFFFSPEDRLPVAVLSQGDMSMVDDHDTYSRVHAIQPPPKRDYLSTKCKTPSASQQTVVVPLQHEDVHVSTSIRDYYPRVSIIHSSISPCDDALQPHSGSFDSFARSNSQDHHISRSQSDLRSKKAIQVWREIINKCIQSKALDGYGRHAVAPILSTVSVRQTLPGAAAARDPRDSWQPDIEMHGFSISSISTTRTTLSSCHGTIHKQGMSVTPKDQIQQSNQTQCPKKIRVYLGPATVVLKQSKRTWDGMQPSHVHRHSPYTAGKPFPTCFMIDFTYYIQQYNLVPFHVMEYFNNHYLQLRIAPHSPSITFPEYHPSSIRFWEGFPSRYIPTSNDFHSRQRQNVNSQQSRRSLQGLQGRSEPSRQNDPGDTEFQPNTTLVYFNRFGLRITPSFLRPESNIPLFTPDIVQRIERHPILGSVHGEFSGFRSVFHSGSIIDTSSETMEHMHPQGTSHGNSTPRYDLGDHHNLGIGGGMNTPPMEFPILAGLDISYYALCLYSNQLLSIFHIHFYVHCHQPNVDSPHQTVRSASCIEYREVYRWTLGQVPGLARSINPFSSHGRSSPSVSCLDTLLASITKQRPRGGNQPLSVIVDKIAMSSPVSQNLYLVSIHLTVQNQNRLQSFQAGEEDMLSYRDFRFHVTSRYIASFASDITAINIGVSPKSIIPSSSSSLQPPPPHDLEHRRHSHRDQGHNYDDDDDHPQRMTDDNPCEDIILVGLRCGDVVRLHTQPVVPTKRQYKRDKDSNKNPVPAQPFSPSMGYVAASLGIPIVDIRLLFGGDLCLVLLLNGMIALINLKIVTGLYDALPPLQHTQKKKQQQGPQNKRNRTLTQVQGVDDHVVNASVMLLYFASAEQGFFVNTHQPKDRGLQAGLTTGIITTQHNSSQAYLLRQRSPFLMGRKLSDIMSFHPISATLALVDNQLWVDQCHGYFGFLQRNVLYMYSIHHPYRVHCIAFLSLLYCQKGQGTLDVSNHWIIPVSVDNPQMIPHTACMVPVCIDDPVDRSTLHSDDNGGYSSSTPSLSPGIESGPSQSADTHFTHLRCYPASLSSVCAYWNTQVLSKPAPAPGGLPGNANSDLTQLSNDIEMFNQQSTSLEHHIVVCNLNSIVPSPTQSGLLTLLATVVHRLTPHRPTQALDQPDQYELIHDITIHFQPF